MSPSLVRHPAEWAIILPVAVLSWLGDLIVTADERLTTLLGNLRRY